MSRSGQHRRAGGDRPGGAGADRCDIHFHYKRAIESAAAGAACLRINPGNIGAQERVREVVRAARDNGCSMRIGVNGGSLEKNLLEKYGEPCPEALVESALTSAARLLDEDFDQFKISVEGPPIWRPFFLVPSGRAAKAGR